MRNLLASLLLLLPVAACSAPTPEPAAPQAPAAEARVEGRDYVRIDPPARFVEDDRIEVVEVFAYTCPHCANIEPLLQRWKAGQGEDLRFQPLPLAFGGAGEAFGRLFFAAEAMGVLDKTHQATFDALHVARRQFRNLAEVMDHYAELGVDREAIESGLTSFPVETRLAQSRELIPRWGVEGTPALIVDGRYRVLGGPEGGLEGVIATLDHLVAELRAERAGN